MKIPWNNPAVSHTAETVFFFYRNSVIQIQNGLLPTEDQVKKKTLNMYVEFINRSTKFDFYRTTVTQKR